MGLTARITRRRGRVDHAAEVLKQALRTIGRPPDSADRRALREVVFVFVDERKRLGWTPERVIIGVKPRARDAGIRPSRLVIQRDARIASTDFLLVQMVQYRTMGIKRSDRLSATFGSASK